LGFTAFAWILKRKHRETKDDEGVWLKNFTFFIILCTCCCFDVHVQKTVILYRTNQQKTFRNLILSWKKRDIIHKLLFKITYFCSVTIFSLIFKHKREQWTPTRPTINVGYPICFMKLTLVLFRYFIKKLCG
jgi:hypothetical protein